VSAVNCFITCFRDQYAV